VIEVDSTGVEDVIIVRFREIVTTREFVDLAATIADFGLKDRTLVYLDWVGIDRWEFTVPRPNGVTAWRWARKTIKRAAIVHPPRLNRQAAWLAAILRGGGVEVRSWRPRDAAAAAIWLGLPFTAATLS
jgi:hypothetical protein